MPASKSIAGLRSTCSFFGQKYAIYTAVSIPIGTPIATAPAVTYILPSIIGSIPYILLFGFHLVPVKNFPTPILSIAGSPFANRK